MTQGQWLRLVGKNPSGYVPGSNFGGKVVILANPVEQVSWDDCDLWLGRLGLILPTEAQWEYAARGGTTTPWWTGLGKDGLAKAANLADAFFTAHGGPPSSTVRVLGRRLHACTHPSGRSPPIRSGSTTCSGTSGSGAATGMASYRAAPRSWRRPAQSDRPLASACSGAAASLRRLARAVGVPGHNTAGLPTNLRRPSCPLLRSVVRNAPTFRNPRAFRHSALRKRRAEHGKLRISTKRGRHSRPAVIFTTCRSRLSRTMSKSQRAIRSYVGRGTGWKKTLTRREQESSTPRSFSARHDWSPVG